MLRGVLYSLMAIVLSSALAACVQLSSIEGLPRPPRAAIEAYSLTGRIAVHQGEQRYSAGIAWQHDALRDEILLSSPLGQGIAELTRDAGGARLTMSDRKEYSASDWEGLSARMFGFPLPLSLLPRWVVADAPEGATLDASGRPKHFVAAGWTVDYPDYENEAESALPQWVELKRDDIELKLKIDEWQIVK